MGNKFEVGDKVRVIAVDHLKDHPSWAPGCEFVIPYIDEDGDIWTVGDWEGSCLSWERLELVSRTVPDTKASNPKDAIGSTKLPLHLVPPSLTATASLAFLEGALKYGRSNWREAGVRATVYVAACKRHLDAWLEGEDVTSDTGTPHLANALACIGIIIDSQATGTLNDDRNYNGAGYLKLVNELTPQVAFLQDLFKDKAPQHYTIADNAAD
jgi:hypothetical protein